MKLTKTRPRGVDNFTYKLTTDLFHLTSLKKVMKTVTFRSRVDCFR